MKNLFISMIFIFLVINSLDASIKFREDFNDNSFSWSITDDKNKSTKIENGYYRIENKGTQGSWNFWKSFPVYYERNFTIESKITLIDGVDNWGYGIIWGAENGQNMYAFNISANGHFCIYKFDKGNYSNIKSWAPDRNIKNKSHANVLKIKQEDRQWFFYINNVLVFDTLGSPDFGSNIGFNITSNLTIDIDYLQINYDTAKINLINEEFLDFKKENLGPNINSEFEEVIPLISQDGKKLYFTRKGHPDNIGKDKKDDIWYSEMDENGNWIPARIMESPLNNDGFNSVISVSPDGNSLLVMNTYSPDGKSLIGGGISISNRTTDGWEVPKKINIENFYNTHARNFSEYCLNSDKNVIIMTVQRNDSYGEKDLYISFKNGNSFTTPKHLGPVLNTYKNEVSPFLASDNTTLYFSSHGHPGYGNADVFLSRRLDSTWMNWSEPINLGPQLNTADWDAYYTLPASGEYAYFVSNEDAIGGSDIFRIKLPESAKPKPVILVYGKVLNTKTNKPESAEIIYNELKTDKIAGTAISDPKTGEYKIVLPYGKAYSFLAEKKGFYAISDNLDASNIYQYKEIERNLYLTPIDIGEIIRLNNIFFDYDNSELKEESYPEINRLIKILQESPEMIVEINGHTDNQGNHNYNIKLSNDRAISVMNYMLGKGIPKKRLTAKGFGKNQPIATNDTEEGRQQNRRVEFKIISK
jgi:outer membrane protein OmpA-like peptidoglycan-associated protein